MKNALSIDIDWLNVWAVELLEQLGISAPTESQIDKVEALLRLLPQGVFYEGFQERRENYLRQQAKKTESGFQRHSA